MIRGVSTNLLDLRANHLAIFTNNLAEDMTAQGEDLKDPAGDLRLDQLIAYPVSNHMKSPTSKY